MRGRKPAPNALKKLRGSRYVNDHEPPVDDGKPACPSYLTDEAKTVWRYHADNLHAADLLKKTDRDTFAGYCEAVADFRRATEKLQEEEVRMVYQTHNGNWVENPYVHQKNRAMQNMLKFAAEFGMTPSARTRFKQEPKDADPLDAFFANLEMASRKAD